MTDPTTRVVRDLREIENLYAHLALQAVNKATDRLMPGGLAMVALAGVANLEAHGNLLDTVEQSTLAKAYSLGLGLKQTRDLWPGIEDDDDFEPPLQVLCYWTEPWRQILGNEYDVVHAGPTWQPQWHSGFTPTLSSEANFIRWALDWAWANEPHWDDFAADINAARVQLENLLHAGVKHQRTRVRCDRDHCTRKPPLIRTYHPRQINGWRCWSCRTEVPTDCDLDACPRCGTRTPPDPIWWSNPDLDAYRCTCCKTWFNEDDFKRALAKHLRSTGAERFVLLGEAIAVLRDQGRPRRTIGKWLGMPEHIADQCTECGTVQNPGEYAACPEDVPPYVLTDPTCGGLLEKVWDRDLIEGYCELGTRRRWIWWPDLWRQHLTTPLRKTTKETA